MPNKLMRKIGSTPTNEYFMLGVFIVLAVWPIVLEYLNGGSFNNFLIYAGVSDHFFASQPLYTIVPEQYADTNLYGPFFAFIIYPFTLMPLMPALLLWVVGSACLLWYAIRSLPIGAGARAVVMIFAAVELYNAAAYVQFGIVTSALIVLSFSMIIRQREGWAALCIVIGMLIKIYGVVGLAFFFFIEVRRMPRFIGFLAMWSAVLIGVQFVFVGFDYLISQYGDWMRAVSVKDLQNRFAVFQNRGLLGMVRKISGSIYYNDIWLVVSGLVLFFLPYLRFKQYRAMQFRLTLLASVLLYLVLFSSGTETCSYISAILGVGIWFVARPTRRVGVWGWIVVGFVGFGSLANAILPPSIYHGYFFAYALKALPFAVAWLTLVVEMMTLDYRERGRYMPINNMTKADVGNNQ